MVLLLIEGILQVNLPFDESHEAIAFQNGRKLHPPGMEVGAIKNYCFKLLDDDQPLSKLDDVFVVGYTTICLPASSIFKTKIDDKRERGS